jgi:hypothetical protein
MSENGSDRELILGNKQLLAIFFVAALLCGVFFAVGYVVGGNSVKTTGPAASDSSTPPVTEGKRDEPPAATPSPDPLAVNGAAGASGTPISDTANAAAGPESKIVDNPAAAGSAPPPSATPAPASPAQTAAVTKAAPAPSLAATASLSIPEKGASYLQVAAQRRPAADATAKSLRDRGWPTILAESSKPDLVEVLVGPYSGIALAEAKRKLTDLGFSQLIIHKQQ